MFSEVVFQTLRSRALPPQAPFKAHDDNSTIIDEIDERAAATSFEHPEEASATPPAA